MLLKGKYSDIKRQNNIFLFDGTNEMLRCSSSDNFWAENYKNKIISPQKNWTFSTWLQTSTIAAGTSNFFRSGPVLTGDSFLLFLRSGSNLIIRIGVNQPTTWENVYNSFFVANTPYHLSVIWTYDFSGSDKIMTYKNGLFISPDTTNGTPSDFSGSFSSGSYPCISYDTNGWNGYIGCTSFLQGRINPMKLFNMGNSYDICLRSQSLFSIDLNSYNWNGTSHGVYDFFLRNSIQGSTENCEQSDITNNSIFK